MNVMYIAKLSNLVRSEGDPKILRSGPSSLGTSDQLAKALGWFSLGLGIAELIAPRRFTRALGMEGSEGLVRGYGVREIAAGMMTLSPDKTLGLWSRVAGDGLDIVTLLASLRHDNPKRANVACALSMVLGVTLLDFIGARATAARHTRTKGRRRLYTDRSGFPKGLESTRRIRRSPPIAPTASMPPAALRSTQ
jgi:hypothetical protein